MIEKQPADVENFRAMVLQSCGADVKTASSVSQACLVVERERPDVLVTDLAEPMEFAHVVARVRRS